MRRFALLIALIWANVASAASDWDRLTGAEIADALTDATYVYGDTAQQRFYASGRTKYTTAQDSWGYWAVRGDRYCSQWPPADGWVCYDVETDGHRLRFVGAGGDITIGTRQ